MGIHQDRGEPWRKWYKTARWRRLRLKVFLRDNFTCQCGCARIEGNTSLLVADHKVPHRGSAALFWDEDNVQTMLKVCHDGAKQRAEQPSLHKRGQWDFAVEPAAPHTEFLPTISTAGKMARPGWFRKVYVPTTVVCGPPGSGKSTYVRKHARPDDRIICFDEIATSLFGRSSSLRSGASLSVGQVADVLRVRNEAIADLMYAKARERWRAAWIILIEPQGTHRQWWADVLQAHVVLLLTPAAECLQRITADSSNGDDRGSRAVDVLTQWWGRYTSAACDQIIKEQTTIKQKKEQTSIAERGVWY